MRSRVLMFSILAFSLGLLSGCRPNASAWKALKSLLPKVSKAVPKAGKSVSKILPGAAARGSKVFGHGLETVLSKSKAVGQRLTALQPRIPLQAYAHLHREWQQNDAELRSIFRQLQDTSLSDDRRTRLESKAKAAADRLSEIERLTDEYG